MARMPIRPLLLAFLAVAVGCGSTKSRLATEQLLVSDAVDQAIGGMDFRSLAGENVYFDTRYLVNVKGVGFVNSEYIISSLRQQMVAADLRLKEKADDADFVVEARVGTLGSDGNEIIYGIPANKGLSEASRMVPGAPPLPAIPEISVARKEAQLGAVKVAAFAYDRKTGSPVWQSGIARTRTTSQDVWLFGAGPFQRGTIHSGMEFAGGELEFPHKKHGDDYASGPPVVFGKEFYFPQKSDEQVAAQPDAPNGPIKSASASSGGAAPSSNPTVNVQQPDSQLPGSQPPNNKPAGNLPTGNPPASNLPSNQPPPLSQPSPGNPPPPAPPLQLAPPSGNVGPPPGTTMNQGVTPTFRLP